MTELKVAERVGRISTSPSAVASQRARELKAEGHDMIALSAGEPDFQTPPHVIEAAHRAMLDGQTKYTSIAGTPDLKAAVQEKFRRENGLDYETDEIIVSNGAKQSIFNAIMATVEKGDEVIIPAPYWISYEQIVQLVNGTAKVVPCGPDAGFKLSAEALEGAITPQSRLLMINTPSNPSGAVYTEDDLKQLAEVLRKHPQIWILTDDIYEHIVFDGLKAATIAVVAPDLKDRTITVNGVSKAYSMTGFRVGFVGAPKALTSQMIKVQSQSTSGASSVGQAAALAALTGPQDFVETCRQAYQDRRDLIVSQCSTRQPASPAGRPKGPSTPFPDCAGLDGHHHAGRQAD